MERRLVRRCGRACRRVGRHVSMPIVSCLLPSMVPYVDGAAICTACFYLCFIRSVSFSGMPLRGKVSRFGSIAEIGCGERRHRRHLHVGW